MSTTSVLSQSSRPTGLPLLLVAVCSIVIIYTTFFVSTFDGIETGVKNGLSNKNSTGSFLRKYAPATDKTYKSSAEEGDSNCSSFDHGDPSPTPGVQSLFNCGSEEGKCKWHFPAKFFDKNCGVGKAYAGDIQTLKEMHENRTLWLDGPPIVIPWVSLSPRVTAHQFRRDPYPVHNLSMTHVHKTGGTSLVNAFGAILRHGARGKRHLVYMPGKKNGRRPGPNIKARQKNPNGAKDVQPMKFPLRPLNSSQSYQEVDKFLNGAVKYKSDWGMFDHTLFAVIRDPAERFISAIGQATGAFGSTMNGIGKQLLKECLKLTSAKTLSCFVDLVQNNGTLIEVHFTPMVMEISFATMWKDIPVAVFPFQEVKSLLKELGADPNSKKKDGHQSGYRKDPILTNMTSAHYDLDSITKLCQIYWADVLFLNHIGYESNCDWMLKEIEFPGIKKEEPPHPVL